MRYIFSLHSSISLAIETYIAILKEAFSDINDFIDKQLESDHMTKLTIVGIIATPIIGSLWFVTALMLTA